MSYQINISLEKNESGYLASCLEITDRQFQGTSLDTVFDDLKKAIDRDLQIQENSTTPKVRQPIWKIAQLLIEDMTEEELDRLPNDGAEQHDFYIYGTPKQEK
ncbi:MAG: hypothetical protein SXA11_12640 [Cyanobacteriota bacterium]|nr:hypothetical protein [Cyanobacteriota bacterium]